MNNKALFEVSVGDTVIVHRHMHGKEHRALDTVTRTTKTQIITSRQGRYRKSNGNLVGNTEQYYRDYLTVASPEEIQEIKKEKRRIQLKIALLDGVKNLPSPSMEKLYAYYLELIDTDTQK